MSFSPEERRKISTFLEMALQEDVGSGDLTTSALIPRTLPGIGRLIAGESGVMAGGMVLTMLFEILNVKDAWSHLINEGEAFEPDDVLGIITAPAAVLLTGERLALNILQRMCGIAAHTRQYALQLKGMETMLLDTRKTTPGMRVLERHAVRMGGGVNHRFGLFDRVLIKDNHLAVVGDPASAVARARERCPGAVIEVEVTTMEQFRIALTSAPDWILLDNMDFRTITECRSLRDQRPGPVPRLEASGGVRLETIRRFAETGVDAISVGDLTHGATWLDISMDLEL